MTVRKLQFFFILGFSFIFSLQGQLTSKKYIVGQIEFEGNESFHSDQLQKVIKLKKLQLTKSSEFNRRSLKLDAITLKNFYMSNGFLEVSVEESFEISEYERVDILFRIKEGSRSYLQSVNIDGNTLITDSRLMRILELRLGKPFNSIGLRQHLSELEHEYGRLGKLFVKIDPRYISLEDINLTISIEEGPTVRIDKIIINGLSLVDSSIVLRELRIKEGTIYNEDMLELSQRQIFETGLFSFVDIFPVKSSEGEDLVNIKVDLREFTRWELLIEPGISQIRPFSSGWEPVSGVEGAVQLLNRSFLKSGSRFRMEGSVQFPVEVIEMEIVEKPIFRLEASISGPWIYRWRAPYTLRLFAERVPDLTLEDEILMRFGGEWNGLHRFSEMSILRGGLRWARVTSFEEREGIDTVIVKRKEQERGLRLAYRYRDLDNPIMPTQGMNFFIESSIVQRTLKDIGHYYYSVEFDYRRFLPIGSSRVLAFRAKVGRMEPFEKPEKGITPLDLIPRYDRFYLGGSTSLRGWPSQKFLTVGNGKRVPKGGLLKVLVSAEVRIPIWWRFGLDVFIDSGILAEDASDDFQEQVQRWLAGKGWNYGLELTITTPLGPIRLYYAIPFDQPTNMGIVNLGVPYAF